MPDVQIYENPAHMVQRLRTQLAQTKAETKGLRDIIEEVVNALPQIGGEAGAAIAAEILKALPPAINASDPNPHGGYAALPAPTANEVQPHLQLGQGQGQHQQARPTRALPAQGQSSGESVVMGVIPQGFPLDAIPPEFRDQAARQSGQPAPQPAPAQRFGGPRAAPQRQAQAQTIDVSYQEPYHQPGTPQATIQRNVGLSDVISEGRGPANEKVKVGRLSVNGRPTGPAGPAGPAAPGQQRPPGKLAGLQAAIAKARPGNG